MSGQQSEPPSAPLSGASLPSSFDDSEFFEESRSAKLWRKIRQEPLIPLGCLATCFALFQASRSIRQGNPIKTNKMFRMRIYAQGFTLAAIVAGSIFYRDERMKRKAFEGKLEDKKQSEKREKWLKELEARDKEDRDWRDQIEKASRQVADEGREALTKGKEQLKGTREDTAFPTKCAKEESRNRAWEILWRTQDAWRRR